jgi:hypothetical protein
MVLWLLIRASSRTGERCWRSRHRSTPCRGVRSNASCSGNACPHLTQLPCHRNCFGGGVEEHPSATHPVSAVGSGPPVSLCDPSGLCPAIVEIDRKLRRVSCSKGPSADHGEYGFRLHGLFAYFAWFAFSQGEVPGEEKPRTKRNTRTNDEATNLAENTSFLPEPPDPQSITSVAAVPGFAALFYYSRSCSRAARNCHFSVYA